MSKIVDEAIASVTKAAKRGPRKPLAERFWCKVDKSGDCWEWTAARFTTGYGKFMLDGKTVQAHRLSYAMTISEPGSLHVLDRCDNRKCVRPAHLFLGTNADNIADKVAKGRAQRLAGEQNPNAVLTEDFVRAIRADARPKTIIAKQYGVTDVLIGMVQRREAWRHI